MKKKNLNSLSFRLIKKQVWLFAICIASLGRLHADWDPEFYLMNMESSSLLDVLNDQKYNDLKAKVCDYLESSWCSKDKANLIMDLIMITRPVICVEIGAFTGSTVLPAVAVLKHLGYGQMVAIDAWSNEVVTHHLNNEDPNKAWWASINMKEVRKNFNKTLEQWSIGSYCRIISRPSVEAAGEVGEIDFLHLDGDYSEIGSTQDVENFLPKVKSGGYILLSNVLIAVNNQLPKMKSFLMLYDKCEMVCEIDKNNTILFRKL